MENTKTKKPQKSVLYLLFLYFFPLIFLCVPFIDMMSKLNARNWVEGHATVLSRNVYQRESRGHPWCEKITYRYSIDRKIYEGNKRSSAMTSAIGCNENKIKTEDEINSIPLGGVISIYYDKNLPSDSAIEIEGFHFIDFAYMVFAFLVIFAGGINIRSAIFKK